MHRSTSKSLNWRAIYKLLLLLRRPETQSQGFVLPMALILSLIMVMLMTSALIQAQSSKSSSQVRQTSGTSAITSDSAVARVLVELSKPRNSELLALNYDPTNPSTGKNYLGPDGVINSNDETGITVDQWSSYNPSTLPCYQQLGRPAPNLNLSGTIGSNGTYQILAYRYVPSSQLGTVLVEGTYKGIKSHVLLTLAIHPSFDDFPGIGLIEANTVKETGAIALRGRTILGDHGNIYTNPTGSADPSLTGRAAPGALNRSAYLNSIWSSSHLDGAPTDTVSGSIIACNLKIQIPQGITGTNLGVIDTTQTLSSAGPNTTYQLDGIDLSGSEVLTIDTTLGPVNLEIGFKEVQTFSLRDNAKILNSRTDGQPPKVGDVRIFIRHNLPVQLYGQSCISNVFLYSYQDELWLHTNGPGCPSGKNTNFEGVVWAEGIFSSKNHTHNRNVNYLQVYGFASYTNESLVTPGATSGIAVPDDVSSLLDLMPYIDWPMTYQYGHIQSWQQVRI